MAAGIASIDNKPLFGWCIRISGRVSGAGDSAADTAAGRRPAAVSAVDGMSKRFGQRGGRGANPMALREPDDPNEY